MSVTKKEADGKSYPKSDYAYTPSDNVSEWRLRLTSSPGGKPDPHIVGAAVAALGKGFRGNKVSIPSKDLPAVKRKVLSAWKKANAGYKEEDIPDVLHADGDDENMDGTAPPGWKHSVERMKKKHKDISNPFALAWYLHNRGYKPHRPDADEDAAFEQTITAALTELSYSGMPQFCAMAAQGNHAAQARLLDASRGVLYTERRW